MDKTTNSKNRHSNKVKLVILIVSAVVIGATALFRRSPSSSKDSVESDTNALQEQLGSVESEGITQEIANRECRDSAVLRTTLIDKNISVYSYNDSPSYSDYVGYDKDGNKLIQFSWSGMHKSTKKAISFYCVLSGTGKDDANIHYLSMDGVPLVGSDDFDIYSENGLKIGE